MLDSDSSVEHTIHMDPCRCSIHPCRHDPSPNSERAHRRRVSEVREFFGIPEARESQEIPEAGRFEIPGFEDCK
jgi:hypothetical protein